MDSVYFWHIPKTAGTSVSTALVECLTDHPLYLGNTLDVLWGESAPDARGASLFCGHFGSYLHVELARAPRFTFTVLRDPVEQAWSYYRFLQRIPEFAQPGGVQGVSLEELLEHPVRRRLFSNLQARWLTLDAPREQWHQVPTISSFTHHSAFELQDLAAHGLGSEQDLLARARARLRSMTTVGTTGRLEQLFARLREHGLSVRWTGQRHNAAPDEEPLPTSLRAKLEAANTVDLALFEEACS